MTPPQKRDHFTKPPRRRLGALGILRNSAGAVLMARHHKDVPRPWYHPGGCVEENERIFSGLTNAARDRLGIDLKPTQLLAVHHMPDEMHGDTLSKEGVNFLYDCGTVDHAPEDFALHRNVAEVRYLTPEEFSELLPPFTEARTLAALHALQGGGVQTLEGHPDTRTLEHLRSLVLG